MVELVVMDSGEKRLNDLGYKQTLKRELSSVMAFCCLAATLSTPVAIPALFTIGFTYGGPVTMVWGWVLVCAFTMTVVLSLAEILSSLPTSGGIYYHAYHLGGEKWGKVACWYTGWFNWLGYVAGYGAGTYIFAQFIVTVIQMSGSSCTFSSRVVFAICCGIVVLGFVSNLMPVWCIGLLAEFASVWNLLLALFLLIGLPAIAPTHQSVSYVFTEFIDNGEFLGIDSRAYLFFVGLLFSQFCFVGFDLNGHLSEETIKSDSAAAWSTVLSTATSMVVGFGILLSFLFSMQDPLNLQNPENITLGLYPGLQLIYDVFEARFGTGKGATVVVACFLLVNPFAMATGGCAVARLMWAMSRDGATPFSSIWMQVTPKNKVPLPAVALTFAGMLLFVLPIIWSPVAFTALSSFSTVGVYVACAIPILMKMTVSRKTFVKGPFHLGNFSVLVNSIAILWVAFITVVFSLPTIYPVTAKTLNYAPIVLGGVMILITIPWLLPRSIFDFKGPQKNLTDFDTKE